MLLNKTILIGTCLIGLITISSCDNKKREQQIRQEAEREILNKNITNKALKDSIILEDNKIFGLVSKIKRQEELSAFDVKLKESHLDECLIIKGEFTVFAPHNKAFEQYSSSILDKESSSYNKRTAMKALKYHVVEKKWTAEHLEAEIIKEGGSLELQTQNGNSIKAELAQNSIILRDESGQTARILTSDITASNGTLYIIDTVLSAD